MFKTRLISGIVLVALALVCIITGNTLLLAVSGLISLIGLFELYRVFGIEKSCAGGIGYLAVILYYCNLQFSFIPDIIMFVIGLLVLLMAVYVFSYPKYDTQQILAAFFGVFYVAVMLSFIYQTRMLPGGAYVVWLIFLCSWGCDTCAYCVGMLCGRHKMAPKLSPKKTWEGAAGGVLGSALLTLVYSLIFQGSMGSTYRDVAMLCVICAVGAVISMVGDLAASAVKRNYDIKDYGKLIPGHGGILDRFDSVIFTAPVIYFLALYLIGK